MLRRFLLSTFNEFSTVIYWMTCDYSKSRISSNAGQLLCFQDPFKIQTEKYQQYIELVPNVKYSNTREREIPHRKSLAAI